MRLESTLFLDPLLEPPAVPPIVLPFDWSHWRNYIVLGSESFFFSLSSFVKRNSDIRCRYVALITIVPSDACPAISFVFFHYSQYLPLLHSNGPFTGTLITEKMHYRKHHIYIHIPPTHETDHQLMTYLENYTWLCISQWEQLVPHPQSHRQTLRKWPGRHQECFHLSELHQGWRNKQTNCVSCTELA